MFILSSSTELSAVPAAVPDRAHATRHAALAGVTIVLTVPVILVGQVAAVVAAHVVAAAAAIVDVRSRRLPNRLVALVAATAVLGVVAASHSASPSGSVAIAEAAGAAAVGAVVLGGPMFVTHLAAPSAIGFGDVKLGAALGAVLGPLDPRLGLVALCIASGATACAGLATRRRELPLGPGLVIGSAVAAVRFGSNWW